MAEVVKIVNVRRVLKEVEEKRKCLVDASFASLFRDFGSLISKSMKKIPGLVSSEKDKLELKTIFETATFMTACKVIVDNIDDLIDFCSGYPNVMGIAEFDPTKFQYYKKEAIISFYGDSNAGKSTLLNCILGDKYLPVSRKSETAVSVHIQFLDPNDQSSDFDEVLCSLNEKESILASGRENIGKMLHEINDQTRKDKNGKSLKPTYVLKLRHQLGAVMCENRKCILFDNPGCDEYGTETVSNSINMAKAVSSAFFFVTTIDGYTKLGSSKTLKSLYSANPEILNQHRLTIIINKLDSALVPKFDEYDDGDDYISDYNTREKIISSIRHFFCSKVFNIDEKDLPQDSVILVSGMWAILGRLYKKKPVDCGDPVIQNIKAQIVTLKSIEEFKDQEDVQDVENKLLAEKANILEKYSNISILEKRLTMVTEKSALFWKQKMIQDLNQHLTNLSSQLQTLISSKHEELADLMEKITKLYEVMLSLNDVYSKIMESEKLCKKKELPHDHQVLIQFREAYERDMQVERNVHTLLLNDVDQKLDVFELTTKQKIEAGIHTTTVLRKDLKQLFESVSGSMSRYISCLENLTIAFQKANTDVQVETEALKIMFSPSKKHDQEVQNTKNFGTLPKLSGPLSEISLKIPIQLSPWQEFLKFWKTLFKMPLDQYDKPVFEAHTGASLDEYCVVDNDCLYYTAKSARRYNSVSESESSLCSYQDEGETTIETNYTKWSTELENMKENMKKKLYEDINAFFENAEENVIQKCCEQHYEVAITILKDFDQAAGDNIDTCKSNLKELIADVKAKTKECEAIKNGYEKVVFMKSMFESISQQEFQNTI